jgi:NAD(P)-dependent dehydrogenase (short-subunit alcohol dehydrogenase family)
MSKLAGKSAIVTGSGRGIGREVAMKLAAEGARVVVNDLDADPAQEVVELIRANGGEAVACVGSVTAPDFADRLIKTTVDSFKGIDIIVNNAGYTWDNVIQKMTDEQWYAILDCHLTAPFRILRAAQPVISAAAKAEAAEGRSLPQGRQHFLGCGRWQCRAVELLRRQGRHPGHDQDAGQGVGPPEGQRQRRGVWSDRNAPDPGAGGGPEQERQYRRP